MSLIFLLLEKFFGSSSTKYILGKTKNSLEGFNSIIQDDLNIDENLYLITDNSKLIFEKYRKKLENIIKSKENITKKRLFKKILLILSSTNNGKKFFLNTKDNEQRQKALDQLNKYKLSRILMELSTKGNVYEDNIVENILLLICQIILEFLKYVENIEIENIFSQINKYHKERPKIVENQTEDDYFDLLINSIIKYKNQKGIEIFDYSEELKNKFLIYQKDRTIFDIDKENIFSIFKYLKIIDNVEFRKKILEILYRQNSQKKILYENVTDIVLFETQAQYNKFLVIKDIFLKSFKIVQSMNLIRRLDNNSFELFKELEIEFNELLNKLIDLLNKLIDEKKWRLEKNVFNVYGSSIYNNEENNKVNNNKSGLIKNKTIFNDYFENNNYYVSEFSKENVFNAQQTLYNLGFVDLVNQIFEYISWIVDTKDELKDELVLLEKILISIYKLLVIFINENEKHQFIIREKLFLYICPLKLNIKSKDMLLFIGYFLLNVVDFFESYEDFNQIQNLDEVIASLNNLKNLEWGKNKSIIPFYVETLKIIISFCSYEYFISIYPILEIINETLVQEILNNSDTNDDILSIIKILELISYYPCMKLLMLFLI